MLCLVDYWTRVKLNRKLLWNHWCTLWMAIVVTNGNSFFQCRIFDFNDKGISSDRAGHRTLNVCFCVTCGGQFDWNSIFQYELSYKYKNMLIAYTFLQFFFCEFLYSPCDQNNNLCDIIKATKQKFEAYSLKNSFNPYIKMHIMRKKATDQHRFRLAHKYKYKYILLSDLCGAFHIQSQLLQQKQHHQLWKEEK